MRLALHERAAYDTTGSYQVIRSGTCASAGLDPIALSSTCEDAATALKLSDTTATENNDTPRPEGCYLFEGLGAGDTRVNLVLNTNSANKGKGAETSDGVQGRHPVCARRTPTTPQAPTLAPTTGESPLISLKDMHTSCGADTNCAAAHVHHPPPPPTPLFFGALHW